MGPTASGKSSLGVFLAQKIGGEILSADSRQVYKGLDIATGKITKKEMAGIPHHLLDVVSPKRQFSVDDFVKMGEKTLSTILQNSRIPIVVGGTGFYIDALLGRITLPNVPPNHELRARLDKKPVDELYAQLKKIDKARSKTIEPLHKRRIIRALEIAEALGKSPVSKQEEKYDVLWLGIALPEEKLRKNIRIRLFARIRDGMVAEARQMHNKGLSYKRMEALGLEYRYLAQLLRKNITPQEFNEQLELAIVHYSKRQMRWFKRNKDIKWIKKKSEALALARTHLQDQL